MHPFWQRNKTLNYGTNWVIKSSSPQSQVTNYIDNSLILWLPTTGLPARLWTQKNPAFPNSMPLNIGWTIQCNPACCLLFSKPLVYIFLKGKCPLQKKSSYLCFCCFPLPHVTDCGYKEQSTPYISWNQRYISIISAAGSNPHLFIILLLNGGGESQW